MAAMDVGDVLEATLNGRFDTTDEMINVLQVKISDAQGGSAAEALAFISEWTIGLMTALSGAVTTRYSIPTIDIHNLTQNTFVGQFITTLGGLNASEALPPQITALIMARTTTVSVEGRKYAPVFGEDQCNGGRWSAAAQAAMIAFGGLWSALFVATNLVAGTGIIVTKLAGVMTAEHPIAATRIIIDARTQRRRTIGRGS